MIDMGLSINRDTQCSVEKKKTCLIGKPIVWVCPVLRHTHVAYDDTMNINMVQVEIQQ